MRRQNSFGLVIPLLIVATVFALPTRSCAQSQDAQSQTDSVADAARKARAQKKTSTEKPTPVITDDILKPSVPAAPRAAGDSSASSDASAASSANSADSGAGQSAGGANGEGGDSKAKIDARLGDLKGQVEEAQKALELAKRELSLEQDNLYSKPDYQGNSAGKAKVDGLNQQVADKQQALDDLKARLAELQAKADAQAPPQ